MLHPEKLFRDLYALDLGTTKFCLAKMTYVPKKKYWRVDHLSVPALGMKRGMVADFDAALKGLDALIQEAERTFSCDIRKVIVGIAGAHLSGKVISLQKTLDGPVTQHVLDLMASATEQNSQQAGRERLHTICLGYDLDRRPRTEDPLGLSGHHIRSHHFLVDGDRSYLRDAVTLCNRAGLTIHRFYAEPVASASVTLPDNLKQAGVALCDIGGGTTDGIVFFDGKPQDLFTVDIAGKMMTQDLAIGLHLSPLDAERVKKYFGLFQSPRSLVINDLLHKQKTVESSAVNAILHPRIHELAVHLSRKLAPHRGKLGGGLLLTGGGSETLGLAEYFEEKMKIPVTRVKPFSPGIRVADFNTPSPVDENNIRFSKLSTVLGLLNLELCASIETKDVGWQHRYFGSFLNWLRELS